MAGEWKIDPGELSTKPTRFEGKFRPDDLERLRDMVANGEGELNYRVSALLDSKRRKVVSCIIEGFVFLRCQSTMDVFRYPVSVEERLVLVDDESHLPPFEVESEEEDYVVAEGPLDARDLVEDAVILGLPMIPRKPGLEAAPAAPEVEKESPFAALRALKRPK